MQTHKIFPVTRVHEPLMLELTVEDNVVKDARVSGLLFRGFELMLKGRDPRDAIFFTQRICGICSTAHGIAAAYALEDAFNLTPTNNGRLIRNILFGADILQNHLRHFYLLTLPDYFKGPDYAPFTPKPQSVDYRFPEKVDKHLLANYWEGTKMAAKAHEILALWGAKAPHQQCVYPTGVSSVVHAEKILASLSVLREISQFIENNYLPDAHTVAEYYSDYYAMGKGYGNLISYGLFPQEDKGNFLFNPGLVRNASSTIDEFNPEHITESVKYSWYDDDLSSRKPIDGVTKPDIDKEDAYSWVKAPRYKEVPYEGGPLARLWINGKYRNGISAMDRIIARAMEAKIIAEAMKDWHVQIINGAPTIEKYDMPKSGIGVGLTDAMRGVLGHWLKVEDYKLQHYQIVTPTAWNFSPRDAKGQAGPVEMSLTGLKVTNPEASIEAARIVHSYDPCFSCAIHLIKDKGLIKFKVG